MTQPAAKVEISDSKSEHASAPSVSSRVFLAVKILLIAGLVMFAAESLRIFVGHNFHTVTAGRCYRSAQPTPAFLRQLSRTHGIRSIVNLRDENKKEEWYEREKKAEAELNIPVIDAGLSSNEQVSEFDFQRFMRAMKDAPEPILIHCANGNDRTGLGSAVYLLLRTDASVADARRQLSLRYGHLWWTKTSCLLRVLDGYEVWLASTGKKHSNENFYFWGLNAYHPE